MAKVTRRYIKNLSPEKIGKLDAQHMIELLGKTRKLLLEQKIIGRTDIWSAARDKLEAYYSEEGVKPIEEYKNNREDRNKAMAEIFRLQEFFNAKTSSVPGALKVARDQDIRLFGKNDKGEPKRRLTYDERTAMWSAYEDFLDLHPNIFSLIEKNPSETVQQFFAQIARGRSSRDDYSVEDFTKLYQDLMELDSEENLERSNYGYKDSDVLSGTRPY